MQDQATELRKLVSRSADDSGSDDSEQPTRLLLAGAKGGVGTTMLSLNLAIAIQRLGFKTLLVEANPTGGDVVNICDLTINGCLQDVLGSHQDWISAATAGPGGISVVPTTTALDETGTQQRQHLSRRLESGLLFFDVVLIDVGCCPITAKAVAPHCNDCIVVTTPDHVALKRAYQMMKSIAFAKPQVWVNKYTNARIAGEVEARLKASCARFLEFQLNVLPAIQMNPMMETTLTNDRLAMDASPGSLSESIRDVARALTDKNIQSHPCTKLQTTSCKDERNHFNSLAKA